MRSLWRIFRTIWSAAPGAMARGAALSVAVLLAGAGLLGLSGWFITAAAAAGLAGAGLSFDVFRPSAGVRALALGRTAARYGERLLTHDATLRALTALRIDLMRRQTRAGLDALLKLRGATALNRITADVDALDGVALRLVLPLIAALLTHAVTFAALAWLVDYAVAGWIAAGYLIGGTLVLIWTARAGHAPSIRAERAGQGLRRAVIDLARARTDLIVFGRMEAQRDAARAADAETRAALAAQDRIERRADLALSLTATLTAAGALALGGALAARHAIDPAAAALGFFTALALSETIFGLRRGMAELGRMRDAADRVLTGTEPAPAATAPALPAGPATLAIDSLTFRRPGAESPVLEGFSLDLKPGETVGLSGPSGAGKSTLLFLAAGLLTPEAGRIALAGQPLADWPDPALRARLVLVPQRTALVAGTIRDNLALATDNLTDDAAWAALRAVALEETVAAKGGLDAELSEGGAGLSGGESRRLALARAVLRHPEILLLDEPTEGLDPATAETVLTGLRAALPQAALLIASHRPDDLKHSTRIVAIA
ncbi:thiol reductant ABC exporter subunit CydC [Acidimangrovimonas pyrenivorans]|uniref:Thiol reductant ABC exporter subunit CydC n=1 Tax=Acidimangrovimonas pyrenivorans TaxID=2030798 RepID=A0ABV7AHP1_9RHOB